MDDTVVSQISPLTILHLHPSSKGSFYWFKLIFFVVLLHTSGSIDELLFAGIERMTLRAYLNSQITDAGSCLKSISAGTCHG